MRSMTDTLRLRRNWGPACAVAVLVCSALAHTQQAPLLSPDQQRVLLERVRANLFRDRELESQYTYLEKRRDVRVSKLGKVSLGDERTFEVYPSAEPGATYKRLVAVNGVPLPKAELEQRDARHLNDMLGEQRRRDAETPVQRAARERRQLDRLARQKREVDEAIAAFDIRPAERVELRGHARPLLMVILTPRPNARASSDLVKYARKFSGTAWVDEADAQVVKVDSDRHGGRVHRLGTGGARPQREPRHLRAAQGQRRGLAALAGPAGDSGPRRPVQALRFCRPRRSGGTTRSSRWTPRLWASPCRNRRLGPWMSRWLPKSARNEV